ncbi:MAG: type II toxin-antitoxin system VapC family toxin [Candidatus Competibacterales bacterium]
MQLLLDTHALLWWFAGEEKLPEGIRQYIAKETNNIYVSAASAWEIATKVRLGKLPEAATLTDHLEHYLASQGFDELPIRLSHAHRAGSLPGHHRDPFDRMLIAQALQEGLTLVSKESLFDDYGVARIW